ncbi:contact-dependent growth inhibition system immunity protein [Streptomyces sp. NPDC057116]|uniref:contact-dependent growth inhibition system immunity protein n=1 Tax=Streptomyces sp. NPDC057116 TaxID=3346023 RepID=UPI00363C78DD
MDRLLHLDRSLDELDPPRWNAPAPEATHLVRKVHKLRAKPLGELRPADLHTLISQQVALPYVLPPAVHLLLDEPLLDAYFYEGDLLLAVVEAPATAWTTMPDIALELRALITSLPQTAFSDLPRGSAEKLSRFASQPNW